MLDCWYHVWLEILVLNVKISGSGCVFLVAMATLDYKKKRVQRDNTLGYGYILYSFSSLYHLHYMMDRRTKDTQHPNGISKHKSNDILNNYPVQCVYYLLHM